MKLIHVLALAPLLAFAPAHAQPASTPAPTPQPAPTSQPPSVQIPDSPAGRALAWVIDCINNKSVDDVEAHFTDTFLAQVPAAQLKAGLEQLRAAVLADKPVRVSVIRPGITKHNLTAELVTDDEGSTMLAIVNVNAESGKMEGLAVRPNKINAPALADYAALDAQLGQLPGSANCGIYIIDAAPSAQNSDASAPVTRSIREIHTFKADSRLALGSVFKLYILGALSEEILAGHGAWDEALTIQAEHKSLPSGRMQDIPNGETRPLSHFADQMISISDNTATDHLLFRTGRANVETYMTKHHGEPSLNKPFLATMEMFKIKLADDQTLPARYADADEAARRAMIADGGEVASATASLQRAANWKNPNTIDRVEWFASPRELAALMADLHRLESLPNMEPLGRALRINPGLPLDTKVWKKIAFKGGSEPGVINGVWMLERADGRLFVITLGWNNPAAPVDERKWAGLVIATANLAAKEP